MGCEINGIDVGKPRKYCVVLYDTLTGRYCIEGTGWAGWRDTLREAVECARWVYRNTHRTDGLHKKAEGRNDPKMYNLLYIVTTERDGTRKEWAWPGRR